MTTQDDYLASLTEAQIHELELLYDRFVSINREEDGPAKERMLQGIDVAAVALDCAELIAANRSMQVLSMLGRDAYAEAFQVFVPTMDLLADRGSEISDEIRTPLETMVVGVVGMLADDPQVPRATIEGFLEQLELQTRSGRASRANLALARAYWHSETGEREAFDDWFDRWVTSDSDWWRPEKYTVIRLTATMLGSFDPHEAVEHLERRIPAMVGKAWQHDELEVALAGGLALTGDTESAWRRLSAILADPGATDLATLAKEAFPAELVRATEAAPDVSPDPRIPDVATIAEQAAAEMDADSTDVVADAAALARHHVRRGNPAEGRRWRDLAEERAAAFDRRNGTDHCATQLATWWFHDL